MASSTVKKTSSSISLIEFKCVSRFSFSAPEMLSNRAGPVKVKFSVFCSTSSYTVNRALNRACSGLPSSSFIAPSIFPFFTCIFSDNCLWISSSIIEISIFCVEFAFVPARVYIACVIAKFLVVCHCPLYISGEVLHRSLYSQLPHIF